MKVTVRGAGNMGGALAKGWARAVREGKDTLNLDVTVTARTQKTLKKIADEYPELNT